MTEAPKEKDKTAKRRNRGEGALFWDEDRQRWIARKIVGYDARGKPITRRASGTSKTAAINGLKRRVKDYEDGLTAGSERATISDIMNDWLEFGLPGKTGAETRKKYRTLVDKHIIAHLGGRRIRDLRADEVDQWLKKLAPHLATRSIQEVKSLLNRAVVRAQARGVVERNVVDLCTVPRGRPGRPSKSLTLDQARDVLAKTQDEPLHPYIVVSLLTGARTEEMRALTWSHVHFEEDSKADPPVVPYIEVWHSVREDGDTKTRKSRRTLALPTMAVKVLKDHQRAQAAVRRAAKRWEDPDLVFPTGNGTEMDAHNVRRSFRNALRNVPGLTPEEWTPREMRHSFVSALSAHKVPLEEISALVGHKGGSQVTELIYRKQIQPVIQTGAKAMDEVFADKKKPARKKAAKKRPAAKESDRPSMGT